MKSILTVKFSLIEIINWNQLINWSWSILLVEMLYIFLAKIVMFIVLPSFLLRWTDVSCVTHYFWEIQWENLIVRICQSVAPTVPPPTRPEGILWHPAIQTSDLTFLFWPHLLLLGASVSDSFLSGSFQMLRGGTGGGFFLSHCFIHWVCPK